MGTLLSVAPFALLLDRHHLRLFDEQGTLIDEWSYAGLRLVDDRVLWSSRYDCLTVIEVQPV